MDMKTIDLKDFPLYCRTCLNQLTGIKHGINQMSKSLLLLFMHLTGYRKIRKDIYPDSICDKCYLTLKNVSEFQSMSRQSKVFLDEIIKALDTTLAIKHKSEDNFLVTLPVTNELNVEDPLQNKEITIKFEFGIPNEDDKMNSTLTTTSKDAIDCVGMETHPENPSEIACNYGCKQEFDSSHKANIHHRSRHITENSYHHSFIKKTEKEGKRKEQIYSSLSSLATHMLNYQESRPYSCDKCDCCFNSKAGLQRHMKIHVENALEIACKRRCLKVFENTHKANVHYQRDYKMENLTDISNKEQTNISLNFCEDCGEDCNNIEHLKQHRTQHQPCDKEEMDGKNSVLQTTTLKETDDNFDLIPITTCNICGKTYSSPSSLATHMRNHQPDRPFPCEKCDRGFNTKHGLRRHMEIHAETALEFACKYKCGKVFDRSHKADHHYKRHHKNESSTAINKKMQGNSTPCICEDCGKFYRNMRNLKQHRIRHLPAEQLPYPCKKCGKRFGAKVDLKFHMMRHDGIRKFECSHCGVKKTTGRELRLHVSNVHTKEMQVSCDICSKIFLHIGSLRRHEKVVHQGIKNYKCNYCDRAFAKGETLRNHEMRHTGKRPYKCNICDRSFIQGFMFNSHMKKHH